MTQAIKVHDGPYVVKYERGADVTANSVVIHGDLVGVDMHGGSKGTLGALDISSVFNVEKTTETAFTAGETVYWNETADPHGGSAETGAATDSVEDVVLGVCVKDAGEDDPRVWVKIDQAITPQS